MAIRIIGLPPAPRACNLEDGELTMKTIILGALLGAVLATTAYAAPVVRDLARTGSTITVNGFADGL